MSTERFELANRARRKVLDQSKAYFEEFHQSPPFVPGETYIPVTAKVVDGDDLFALIDASLDMWLTAGRYAREFEATFPEYFGRKTKALLVNSGSSANLIAISSLGSPQLKNYNMQPLVRGDEVITVAAGFPTTVAPILQNGWVPVFVDVDAQTLNALPEKIMSARSAKTRAVVLAHTLGNPYRADILADWCKKEGLFLVEDCCDALGATIEGRLVGSFGDYATSSFYPAHHITMGEGGAVLSRDGRMKKISESLRDWGRDCWCEPGRDNTCEKRFGWTLGDLPPGYDHKYIYSQLGYNLKVTDMQAALGVAQLKKVPKFIQARRENWAYLNDRVRSSPVLKDKLIPSQATRSTNPSWFGFPMLVTDGLDREQIVSRLEKRRVGSRLLFAGNMTKQPAFKGAEFRVVGDLENTDLLMKQLFWIGVHPGLDKPRMDYMLEQLEAVVKAL